MHDYPLTRSRRVVIVDDVRLNRECLAAQLRQRYPDVREVSDLPSLVREIGGTSGQPSLVLVNMNTAQSYTLLQISLDLVPTPKVIAIGLHDDREADVAACAEAGVAGLHLTSESLEHLLTLMDAVNDGHSRCSPEVSAILLGRVYADAAGYAEPTPGSLTVRESEILMLLEEGLSNKQIADRLCVTIHTVKNHVHSLLGKLGVQSRTEATRHARVVRYSGADRRGSSVGA